MKILHFIKNHLIISIFISITLGIIIGNYIDVSWLKNLILPLTFMLVYPMLVTLNFESLKDRPNFKLQIITQVINFVIFPFVAFAIGYLFFKDSIYIRLGLLLIGLLPTSGMTISWTMLAKGNVNEAIKMVVIGLLIGALTVPLYITVLLGAEVDVPMFDIFIQIMFVIFIPLVVAYLTQKVLIKKYTKPVFFKSIKPVFPLFSTLGVVLILFVAISLKANIIVSNPMILLDLVIPLMLFYLIMFTVSVVTARFFFNRYDGIALVNGTLIRNLSISLAIILSAFPDAGIAALLVAVAYILQVQIAAFNVKLTKYIFKA